MQRIQFIKNYNRKIHGRLSLKRVKFIKQSKELLSANKAFFSYVFKNNWPFFFLQSISILLSGFSAALVSMTSKSFIESIIVDNSLAKAMNHIVFWMCYMLVMHVMQHFSSTYCNYAYAKAQIIVKEEISKKILNLKLSYYDVPENRDALARAVKYAENGGPQLLNYFFSLLTNFVAIVSILYVLNPFAWWIVIFLILLTVYKTVIEVHVSKKNYEFQKERTLLNRKISYFGGVFSNPATILDLNIYNAFGFFFSKYKYSQDESITLNKNHSIKLNWLNILALLAVILQNLVLYLYIGKELMASKISIADFTMFFTAVNYFNSVLSNLRKSFSQFVPMALEAQSYTEFLNVPDNQKYISENSENKINIECIETIEFKNVSFQYPLKNNYILKNVSFIIRRGEIVSLAGMNGAGKTTLIKLMLGLYSATEGEILVNSIPIEKINIFTYWQCCGIMFQQINTYAITAYENITFDETKSNDVSEILKQLDLKELFDKQEKGIHTELSRSFDPNGILLSGGENQKIAFARICHNNRNLLILDEPSSALDAKSENDLFKFVDKMHESNPKQIILFVSHRLSSSLRADKIIFIKNSEIHNVGDHSYMMEYCADYRDLFLMQAENYTRNGENNTK